MEPEPPLPPLLELASDPAWEVRLASVPEDRWEALLQQADALTSGSDEERELALRTYGALQDAIDPAEPAGCDRAEWVLNALRVIDVGFEPLLQRIAERAERAVVRRRAGVAAGAFRVHAGDHGAGEVWFLRVLAESRGSGGIPERGACLNLCRLYSTQKRSFEAYVLARHAVRLFQAAADPMREMLSLTEVLFALHEMREWQAYDEADAAIEALVPTLPSAWIDHAMGAVIRCRLKSLRARGGAQAALDLLDASPPRPHVENETLDDPCWRAGMRGALYADLGRLDEAQEQFATARSLVAPGRPYRWQLLQLQAVCAARRGERELALANAREVLTAGREALVVRLGTGTTMRLLLAVAELSRDQGEEEMAWTALDQAAVVAVERIQEARRAVRSVPELGFVSDEDRAVLARARKRFASEHEDLLSSLALLLQRKDLTGERWLAEFRDGEYTVVCAWCAQVRDDAGTWIPVGHYLPPVGPLKLTHGMCEDCASEWRTEMCERA